MPGGWNTSPARPAPPQAASGDFLVEPADRAEHQQLVRRDGEMSSSSTTRSHNPRATPSGPSPPRVRFEPVSTALKDRLARLRDAHPAFAHGLEYLYTTHLFAVSPNNIAAPPSSSAPWPPAAPHGTSPAKARGCSATPDPPPASPPEPESPSPDSSGPPASTGSTASTTHAATTGPVTAGPGTSRPAHRTPTRRCSSPSPHPSCCSSSNCSDTSATPVAVFNRVFRRHRDGLDFFGYELL